MPKKLSILVLILLLFFIKITSAVPDIDTVYVSAYAVNIRTGPGLDYDKTGVVFINAQLKVISSKEGWLEVVIGDTLDGWISRDYTASKPLTPLQRDKILYRDGDMNSKLRAIKRMTTKERGPEFEFLKDIIINHHRYEIEPRVDKLLLKAIFRGWEENGIKESIPI